MEEILDRPVAGSTSHPFVVRLKLAAQEGILLGVKVAVAFGLIVVAVSYLLNDYNIVRQRAYNGELAFEWVQQQHQAPKATP